MADSPPRILTHLLPVGVSCARPALIKGGSSHTSRSSLSLSLSLSFFFFLRFYLFGQPGWLSGLAPPLAQGMILETGIKSYMGLPAWSLLLSLPVSLPLLPPPFFFLFKIFYLFMRDTQREAETQAEGEAGSMQGVGCGT